MTLGRTVAITEIPGINLLNRGKVRDVYEVDARTLLIVTTDRISAFDCIMPNQIPDKGRVLTGISAFWFGMLGEIVPNHLLSVSFEDMPDSVREMPELEGRVMLVRKTKVFPVECVVRGYLEGSGWKDYQNSGEVCGQKLAEGLIQCAMLESPLFTPATKEESGHDENISFERFCEIVGEDFGHRLRELSFSIYKAASDFALSRGLIIADTKFEFGLDENGEIILIDEVLTPDSSRFWDVAAYSPGHAQPSFDKQFLREYLESLDWDKTPPAPHLPNDIVEATAARYRDAYQRLTGKNILNNTEGVKVGD
ncbi:MAG: phosphoribosylaminoimidazolesuccinocarboxamide synthase [Pyrinomonadaceae bacterium]